MVCVHCKRANKCSLIRVKHLCARCTGHLSCVRLLLSEGADIEQRNVVRAKRGLKHMLYSVSGTHTIGMCYLSGLEQDKSTFVFLFK